MTAYDPGRYATEAGYHGAIELICLTCRDHGRYGNRFVRTYFDSDATIADQTTAAQQHQQQYHPTCDHVSHRVGPHEIGCSLPADHDGDHNEDRITDTRNQ